MIKSITLSVFLLGVSILFGYGFVLIETKETIEYTSDSLKADCSQHGFWSYIYFRNETVELRSNRLRTDCTRAIAKLGEDWKIGVKESTSVVVFILGDSGYLEGNSSRSTLALWKIVLPLMGFGLAVHLSIKAFRK